MQRINVHLLGSGNVSEGRDGGPRANAGPSGDSSPRGGKPGYGIDEPRSIIELAIAGSLAVVVGFVLSAYAINVNVSLAELALLIGPSVGFLILAVASALFWSSRQGKATEMHRVILDIPGGGDETVLDVGCGRGLGMVNAGKQLTNGIAVGVDLWKKSHLSGNDPKSIWANASREGVGDKVLPVKADPMHLPLSDMSVDVLISATSIHRLIPRKERREGFAELARVLRPGGRVGIIDAGNGSEYAGYLRAAGLSDVTVKRLRFSSFPPFHVVQGRKPFG